MERVVQLSNRDYNALVNKAEPGKKYFVLTLGEIIK